ncbi:hypothetical protein [Oryza sativa Japonica Group]|uniref:Uncharacterized protein n=2 Tax=Oryza sativa subsp. japonica TaxID=39947 RepID=Q5VPN8_ORYSJ|nr:hypothetical protein [Oryza sativa Japonica Group]BAD68937.1 hypothetical protein [Oryza sativa Japonica Group]
MAQCDGGPPAIGLGAPDQGAVKAPLSRWAQGERDLSNSGMRGSGRQRLGFGGPTMVAGAVDGDARRRRRRREAEVAARGRGGGRGRGREWGTRGSRCGGG